MITYEIKSPKRSDIAHEVVFSRDKHTEFARIFVSEDTSTREIIEAVAVADTIGKAFADYYDDVLEQPV